MKRTHKLNGIFNVLMAFAFLPAYAQFKEGNIVLPEVERGKIANCKVFSKWKPAKAFLKHNPDFLKNGSYSMTDVYIKKGHKHRLGYSRVVHNGLIIPASTSFTSATYPAVYVPSDRMINTSGNVYIQVLRGSNSLSKFPLCKGGNTHKRKNTGYFSSYAEAAYNPDLRNSYANLNNYYKQKTKEITARKFTNPVYISDIGSFRINPEKYSLKDIFLEFEFVDVQSVTEHYLAEDMILYFPVPYLSYFVLWNYALMITKRKSGAGYPSNLLLQLHVKNHAGQEIKTYKQAIFMKERHLVGWIAGQNYSISTLGLVLKQGLPAATENLISQFAEDTAVMNQINDNNQKTDEFARLCQYLNRWLCFQTKLNEIRDAKTSIETSINNLRANLTGAGITSPLSYNSGLNDVSIPSNASAGAIAGEIACIAILDFGIYIITSAVNQSNRSSQIFVLQNEYNELWQQYQQLTQEEEAARKKVHNNTDAILEIMKAITLNQNYF